MHVTVRPQGAGALPDTQAAELRMLTTRLWDSVARVADGRQVDAEDRAVLDRARLMLKGESETLLAVRNDDYRAAAPWELQGSYPGQGSFTELILRAAEDCTDIPDLRTTPIDRINAIVSALENVARGDVEAAQTYDEFFEYLTGLSQQTSDESGAFSPR